MVNRIKQRVAEWNSTSQIVFDYFRVSGSKIDIDPVAMKSRAATRHSAGFQFPIPEGQFGLIWALRCFDLFS